MNSDKIKSIAIVESEKTAIIASIAFPEFILMGTGSLGNLKYDLITPLANRKVILFPDAGCYKVWNEKDEGWSIADYLIKIYLSRKKNL